MKTSDLRWIHAITNILSRETSDFTYHPRDREVARMDERQPQFKER